MSIRIHLNQLTNEQRQQISTELQIENPDTKQWIHPYHIDEDTLDVFLPYAYASELGLRSKSREAYPNVKFRFTGQLREYQKQVKNEAIQMLNRKGSTLLSLHVGWGKSMLSAYLACKLSFKTLIIVNRLVLVNQWKELFQTVCPDSKIQLIKPNKELNTECDLYLINAQNVLKFDSEYFSTIGTLIVDECHLICAQTLFKCMFRIEPKYILGLSATPHRPDGLDALITFYFGKDKIVKELYRKHTVYAVHTGIKIEYEFTWDGKIDWNSVLQSQAENESRNKLIVQLISKFKERYFLVLCKRISQGQTLVQLLTEQGERVTDLLGNKKEFDSDARIVVATTQKCGVGFSHDKLNALLLASDVEEYFIQYLGRVFRTPEVEPIIFDLVDDLPTLERHFQTRRKTYKKSGGIVTNVTNIPMFIHTNYS